MIAQRFSAGNPRPEDPKFLQGRKTLNPTSRVAVGDCSSHARAYAHMDSINDTKPDNAGPSVGNDGRCGRIGREGKSGCGLARTKDGHWTDASHRASDPQRPIAVQRRG